ncbi:uncharacterized protein BX663DRAFT_506903 [Cokeromyces recurvatus]|uniref:uncharacterized protein n=1 Tax=Cokeromyces recurvatus TaxID=90255 RepID=UPI00221F9CE2|nr:uncharacterized protein BX663DRAFT_506903 [Cokeromyces recurvatus]KAI7903559.1 hypothetical protein BX663DRAFT_506903 [Cokeromyces recurvatus]
MNYYFFFFSFLYYVLNIKRALYSSIRYKIVQRIYSYTQCIVYILYSIFLYYLHLAFILSYLFNE